MLFNATKAALPVFHPEITPSSPTKINLAGLPLESLKPVPPLNTAPVGAPPVDAALVGNFGDGRINAYDESGAFLGPLLKEGKPIVIDGLWGLSFAPATATTVNPDWLFFAAGPKDEADGIFGYIAPEPPDTKKSE